MLWEMVLVDSGAINLSSDYQLCNTGTVTGTTYSPLPFMYQKVDILHTCMQTYTPDSGKKSVF